MGISNKSAMFFYKYIFCFLHKYTCPSSVVFARFYAGFSRFVSLFSCFLIPTHHSSYLSISSVEFLLRIALSRAHGAIPTYHSSYLSISSVEFLPRFALSRAHGAISTYHSSCFSISSVGFLLRIALSRDDGAIPTHHFSFFTISSVEADKNNLNRSVLPSPLHLSISSFSNFIRIQSPRE